MKISPERLRSYLREGNGFYVGNDNYMAYLTEFPGGEDFCLTMIDSTEVLQETHSMYFTFPIFIAADHDVAWHDHGRQGFSLPASPQTDRIKK